MIKIYKNKIVLVSGGAGSIGSVLVKKILEYNPKAVRVLDINETGLFNLYQKLNSYKIRLLVGDIRDKDRLKRAMEDVDIVFHAAALKHVSLCESNPFEAIQTNLLGTKNLIEAAIDEEIERFITISTDKAVNPINVLGASKLLTERLTVSANIYQGRRRRRAIYSCVRFGNVLNSQGSVLPIFEEQVKRGGPVTVTNENMTRFVISIDKATELILKAAQISRGGEIFILKMPVLRIIDLAKAVIEETAPRYGYASAEIKIKFIGKKEGEKMYEELMNADEAIFVRETEDMFILPFYNPIESNKKQIKVYKSKDCKFLTVKEIRGLLKKNSI